MNKKWILAIGAVGLVLFVGMGTLWNYQSFKENAEGMENKNTQVTYTGDAQKPNAGESKERQEPKLELTQEAVDIEIDAVFRPIDFIKVAMDEYGYSVKEKVEIDQEIPTNREGKYEIEYILDLENGNNISRKLIVEVKRMVEE